MLPRCQGAKERAHHLAMQCRNASGATACSICQKCFARSQLHHVTSCWIFASIQKRHAAMQLPNTWPLGPLSAPPVVIATSQDDAKTRCEYGSGTTGPSAPARRSGQRRGARGAMGRQTWKRCNSGWVLQEPPRQVSCLRRQTMAKVGFLMDHS